MKRFLALILSIALTCSCAESLAFAVEEQVLSGLVQQEELSEEEEEIVAAGAWEEDDEALYDYLLTTAQEEIAPTVSEQKFMATHDRLNDTAGYIYAQLLPLLTQVAKGERESTKFQVTGLHYILTASELGLDTIGEGSLTGGEQAAIKKVLEPQIVKKVMRTLLADEPYLLYWFDKTVGMGYGYKSWTGKVEQDGETVIQMTGMSVSFYVSADYSKTGETKTREVDTAKTLRATEAAKTAASVVEAHESEGDVQKLCSYRNYIVSQVVYDHDHSNKQYGDTWQLISVFDNDATTNVVCEGYSKAFKYLCDLSAFQASLSCVTVTGYIGGNPANGHMWNLVTMPNGKNYLVDVTNWKATAPERLFLAGYSSGSFEGGYTLSSPYGTITYVYVEATLSIYRREELELAGHNYADSSAYSLQNATVTVGSATYTGGARQPTVSVTADGKKLTQGQDYEVQYFNNVNAGTGKVTVSGKGDYYSGVSKTFDIYPATLKAADLSVTLYYDEADPSASEISVTWKGVALSRGKDYTLSFDNDITPNDPGYYNVKLTGKGNFSGGATVAAQPMYALLSDAAVSIDPAVYTGQPLTPAVKVTLNGETLEQGRDYTLTVAQAVDAGDYTLTVTGAGSYRGSKTGTFTVAPAALQSEDLSAVLDYEGADPSASEISVTWKGVALSRGRDYTLSFDNDITPNDPGYYNVKLTGKGNFSGGATVAAQPMYALLSDAALSIDPAVYTGQPLTPAVKVTLNGETLEQGRDYTLTMAQAVDAGDYTLTVTGAGSYRGSKTGTFTVRRAEQTVTANNAALYTGRTVRLAVSGSHGALSYVSANSKVAEVNGSGVVTGKLPGTTQITVTAAGDRNHNSARTTLTVKVSKLATPAIPKLALVNGGFKLTWGKVSGAARYWVYCRAGKGAWKPVAKVTGNTATVKTYNGKKAFVSGGVYTFTVRCVSADGTYFTSSYNTTGRSYVYLQGTTLSRLTNSKSRTITAAWKKSAAVNGYQIQYSTSKTFSAGNKAVLVKKIGTLSASLPKLTKGATYYVRIRTWRRVGGVNYYSAWSGAKALKVSR